MKMKQTVMAETMVLVIGASVARATLFTYDFTSGFATTNIPDGNPAGWADSHTISGIQNPAEGGGYTSAIADVSVRLNISGGYNGDLYGYLRLNNGTNTVLTVLLNRVGQGTGTQPVTSFGYGDAGLNVTLSATGVNGNIHNYQQVAGWQTNILNGASWQPEGNLTTFNGNAANGTWTLFLADLSGGNVSSVTSWGLDINVVPEPVTWAIIIFGGGMGVAGVIRKVRRSGAKSA